MNKKELATNVLKALYNVNEINFTKPVWEKRLNKLMKEKKERLQDMDKYAEEIIEERRL